MKTRVKNFVMRLMRHEYLLRMILTIFAILLVPVLAMTYTLIQRSYKEMNTQNNEYYISQAVNFSIVYKEQVSHLLDVAVRIGLDGKLDKENIGARPYRRIEAVKTMADYKMAVPMADYVGICFYDLDYIFTSTNSYTVKRFIEWTAEGNAGMAEELLRLMTEDTGEKITMLPSFDTAANNPAIIAVIPVSTEFSYENNAVVIYSLSNASFLQSFIHQYESEQYGLAIFDSQGMPFFYNREFDTSLCQDENFLSFLFHPKEQYYEYSTKSGMSRVFRWQDLQTGLFFVSVIPESIIMIRLRAFLDSVRLMTLLMLIGLVLLMAVTIYINYRPVISLVRRTRDIRVPGEPVDGFSELKTVEAVLKRIQQKYDEVSVTVSEQQLMIMEYILGNILYGLPIQKEKVNLLDRTLMEKYFLVISVQDLRIDNIRREELTRTIRQRLNITVYITDIQYEPAMVFICIINDTGDSGRVETGIKEILCGMYNNDYIIGAGEAVDSLDDIRKSYLSSLTKLDTNVRITDKGQKSADRRLKKQMLDYVNSNYNRMDINLMQVADHLNISVYTCSRLFKEFTGIGFKEYISAKRMELSKELLLSTNKNIYEIAEEAGFEHSSYFMTWFKANCGMSPSRFRDSRSV